MSARYVRKANCIQIAPSILSADFSKLGEQVAEATDGGADMIHVDVMDGHFVPNITIGPAVIRDIRGHTELPFDVHLMIDNPYQYLDKFVSAGSDIITVHAEIKKDLNRCVKYLRGCGVAVGVSVNPSTPLSNVLDLLDDIDLLLLMTVNPGFGGQDFIGNVMKKVQMARDYAEENGYTIDVEVDGGINHKTVGTCVEAGANILVAGSAIFSGDRSVGENISLLREAANAKIPGKHGN